MVVIFQKNLWPPFDEGEFFQEIVQPQFFEAEISIEIPKSTQRDLMASYFGIDGLVTFFPARPMMRGVSCVFISHL